MVSSHIVELPEPAVPAKINEAFVRGAGRPLRRLTSVLILRGIVRFLVPESSQARRSAFSN